MLHQGAALLALTSKTTGGVQGKGGKKIRNKRLGFLGAEGHCYQERWSHKQMAWSGRGN